MMKIVKDANPVLMVVGIFFLAALVFGWISLALVLLGLFAFTRYFFRDPDRQIPDTAKGILAPADGVILEINDVQMEDQQVKQIVTFMSIFNVHINRIPFNGKVLSKKYFPGKFLAADKLGIEKENEHMEIMLETEFGKMKVVQIAGLIARKIVCGLTEGERVAKGDRFGLIKFGSRVDIYFSDKAKLLVKTGQTTSAGETVLAEF